MDGPWEEYARPSAAKSTGLQPGPWNDYEPAVVASATSAAKPTLQADTGFFDAAARGFRRSLPETKSLLYGAGAALAGAVGADNLRDSALDNYQRVQREEVEPLASKSGFVSSLKGATSLGEWAGDTIGNFGGQALQSAAAGAAGALVGSVVPGAGTVAGGIGGLVARAGAKQAVEKAVSSMVAKQLASGALKEGGREAAEAVARRSVLRRLGGAAAASTGLNVAQETGIGYTGRAEDAAAAGEALTHGDALRAIGWGVPAGLVDTAAEGLAAGRLLHGVSASPSRLKRTLGGGAIGALTEGGTEGVQAAMERAGARQPVTGRDAYMDYIENVAAGALGGGVAGAGGGVKRKATLQQSPSVDEPMDQADTLRAAVAEAKTPAPAPRTNDAGWRAELAAQAVPQLRYPEAAPGSLSDAANTMEGAASVIPDVKVSSNPEALAQRGPAANLDPDTGELLGIDAPLWPSAATHQQPAAILADLVAQGMRSKGGKPPGVSAISSANNIDRDTASALRWQALRQIQEARAKPLQQQMQQPLQQGSADLDAVTNPAPENDDAVPPAAAKPDDIGQALQARMDSAPDEVAAEYDALPDSDGGRILNTDLARELSPDYRQDRTRSADVHDAARAFVRRRYAEKLAQPTPEDMDSTVLFTAGGTGAGKTTGLQAAGDAFGKPKIVYDTNMSSLASAQKRVEQALAAGRHVEIAYVYRDPVEALTGGAIPRAQRMASERGSGRTVPLGKHAKTHTGVRGVIEALQERYAGDDRVNITAIDNSGGKGQERVVDLANLPKVEEDGLHERLTAALDEARAGGLDEALYRGFAAEGRSDRGVGGNRRAHRRPDQSPPPGASGEVASDSRPEELGAGAGGQSQSQRDGGARSRSGEAPAGSAREPNAGTVAGDAAPGNSASDTRSNEAGVVKSRAEPSPPVEPAPRTTGTKSSAEASREDGGADAAQRVAAQTEGGRVFRGDGGFVMRTPQAISTNPQAAAPIPQTRTEEGEAGALVPATPGKESTATAVPAPTDRSEGSPTSSALAATSKTPPTGGVLASIPKVRSRHGKASYVEGAPQTLAAYFTPGALVPSYAGTDRVISLTPASDSAPWQVRVIAVNDDGSPKPGERERLHTTLPSQRELRARFGPPVKTRAVQASAPAKPRGGSPGQALTTAANDAATSPGNDLPAPSQAQKEAGNYQMGHARIAGLDITIEHPRGSKRNPKWKPLAHHYGYIKGTVGHDKDHVDVFLTDHAEDAARPVFVVDQHHRDGSFDEHKVVLGAATEAEARKAYLDNYDDGWTGLGAITPMTQAAFKVWVFDRQATTKPAAGINTARTVEGGRPQSFSKPAPDGLAAPQGLDYDRALALKRELTANWGKNSPNVIVVHDAAGFPAAAKADPGHVRAEGFYHGRPTVWINAAAIPTEQRFAQVLAHEALGHYGVDRVLGDNWDGVVDAIARHDRNGTGAPAVRAAIASVHGRYGALDRTDFAKEVIAVMAERGVRNGLLRHVVAAVRRVLRKLMPSLQWKDADILDLLSQADGFLHRGNTNAQGRAAVEAMAFSHRQALSDFLRGPVIGDAGDAFLRREDSTLRQQVEGYFAGLGGQAVSPQLGTVKLTSAGIKASIAHGIGRKKAAAFRLVPTVIAEGRVIDETLDPSGRTVNRHVVGAPVRIAGEPHLMGVVVRRSRGQPAMFYLHEVVLTPMQEGPRSSIKTGSDTMRANDGGTTGAIGSLLLDAYGGNRDGRFSQAPVQMQVDAAGQRSVEMRGETFVDRGGQFFMANGTGHPKDFRTLGVATEAAQRTGGEVLADMPIEGERPTWSVVAPATAIRGAALPGGRTPLQGLFSKPPMAVVDEVQEVMAADADRTLLERAREALKAIVPAKIKDQLRPTWLGALATRHLTELGGDYFDSIRHYSDFLAEQGADRNRLQAEAEAVVDPARKWAGKHKAEAKALFNLMHDATIDGVDPAKDYAPLQFQYGGQVRTATTANVKEALKAVREQMLGRGGDNKTDMMAEAKMLRSLPAREKRRKARYAPLVKRWNDLPPEAQAIYTQFRDMYEERSRQVEEALAARINDTDVPPNRQRGLINTIRRQFESQRLQGVYFPLQRHGRYFVAASKSDTPVFLMFESVNAMERGVKSLKSRGFQITAQGLRGAGKAKDAPSGTFVAEVIEQMRKAGVSDKAQDEVYQIYLQTLPELSMRKHSIHRKAVPGFDPDAIRAFAFNMHHGAHQLARLRFSHKLQNVLDLLRKQQDAARKEDGADTRRIVAGDAILEELGRRHDWINNPQDSALTNLVSSFGFTYYLGLTPAASLVNLTQTALVTYPYLAARFGPVRAMHALLSGMRDASRTLGNMQKVLTDPEELRAHKALQELGALDKTQSHNLAGIADGGMQGYNPHWAKAMEVVGWGFHTTEVINREASGMAAFRLARVDGQSFEQAVKTAADTIHSTHFDYSNANRARFMQSGTAKVLLMFRQYSLNMTWHLGRMVWNATKGQSPEVRRLARRNLAGVLGMTSLFAGVFGLPMMGVTMSVLNAIASSFGDDDEPWDAKTEFRAFLADMLGETAAATVADGLANQVTSADIASRVSLSDLWIREADRELDGRDAYYNLLEQAAGPMGGVLKNALVGKQLVDEGHLMRGVETMLPKGLKDGFKALRYATEGVNNLRGDPIVADPTAYQALLQLTGFTPNQVAHQYDINRSLKNYEQHILDRRQRLIDAWAMSARVGDEEGVTMALEKIQVFNGANPEIGITVKSMKASVRGRARYSAKAEAGIVLNPKIAAKVRTMVGVGDDS